MNNVWSVAFRLPCAGPPSILLSQWPRPLNRSLSKLSHSGNICQQSQNLSRRGFATTPISSYAKATTKRQPPKPAAKSSSQASIKPVTRRDSIPNQPPAPRIQQKPGTRRVDQNATPKEKATVLLSVEQVAAIVGSDLTYNQGVDLLQEIQYRRVTGSLADKGLQFEDKPEITVEQASRALEWLRDNHPVDEEAAAELYAEEAAQELSKELEKRAQRLRLYKKAEGEGEEEPEEEILPDEEYSKIPLRADQTRDITGESALHARKQYVEASKIKAKKEADSIAAEYEARGEKPPEPYRGHDLVVAKQTALEDMKKTRHERWERLKEEAELPAEELFAERSVFDRLWRPVLFGLTISSITWAIAEQYEPPKSSMRLLPSVLPGTATVIAISLLNLAVFIMWKNPHAWYTLNRNFLLSVGTPRAFSVLGSLFSHQTFLHFWLNMGMLYLIGVPVHEEVGRATFIAIYLSSGIFGYLTSLTVNVLARAHLTATLGASAAIFGIIASYFTLQPKRLITLPLLGEVEYECWIPLNGMIVWELLRWYTTRNLAVGAAGPTSDYLTHLGGLVAGAVMGILIKRRIDGERAEDERIKALYREGSGGEVVVKAEA